MCSCAAMPRGKPGILPPDHWEFITRHSQTFINIFLILDLSIHAPVDGLYAEAYYNTLKVVSDARVSNFIVYFIPIYPRQDLR